MRIYQLPFVPLGLMSKLMTRILHFVTPSVYWKDGTQHNSYMRPA